MFSNTSANLPCSIASLVFSFKKDKDQISPVLVDVIAVVIPTTVLSFLLLFITCATLTVIIVWKKKGEIHVNTATSVLKQFCLLGFQMMFVYCKMMYSHL